MERIVSRLSLLIICLSIFLLQACATSVLKPVSEADKDPTGAFDGLWKVKIKKAAAVQQGPGNWRFNCGGKADETSVSVNDSVLEMQYRGQFYNTFVNDTGQFRLEVPMSELAKASGTSDSSIVAADMTLIVMGSFEEQSGSLTWGVAEFGNGGCTSYLDLEKSS